MQHLQWAYPWIGRRGQSDDIRLLPNTTVTYLENVADVSCQSDVAEGQ